MSFIVIYIYIHSTFTDRVSRTFGLVCLCVIFLRLNKEYSMAVYCTQQSGQRYADWSFVHNHDKKQKLMICIL